MPSVPFSNAMQAWLPETVPSSANWTWLLGFAPIQNSPSSTGKDCPAAGPSTPTSHAEGWPFEGARKRGGSCSVGRGMNTDPCKNGGAAFGGGACPNAPVLNPCGGGCC